MTEIITYPVSSACRVWRPLDSIGGQTHVDDQIERGVYTLVEAIVLNTIVDQSHISIPRDFLDALASADQINAMIARGLLEVWEFARVTERNDDGSPKTGVPETPYITLSAWGAELAMVDIAEDDKDEPRWERRPQWDGGARRPLIQEGEPIVVPPTEWDYPDPFREFMSLPKLSLRLSKAARKRLAREEQERRRAG